MSVQVRRATPADAERLSAFAAEQFAETFGKDNTPADMAHYLANTFTVERQRAEIVDPASTVLLVESVEPPDEAVLIGYAHLASGPAPPTVRGSDPVELKRFYIAREWHGHGVARMLMDAVLDASRARGAQTLWLGVWERNPRAVTFYAKFGFERVGEQSFVLGSDVQTDWVLARSLAGARGAA